MLKVGFSTVSITPEVGLKMSGMPDPPEAKGVLWPLNARVMVLDDGAAPAALVTLDLLVMHAATIPELRQAAIAGTGIAPENVLIACTHTHRAPFTTCLMDEDPNFAYIDFLRARIAEAVCMAWRTRTPAVLAVGSSSAPGLTFNRRPIYQTPNGPQVGTQGPQYIPEFLGMEGPEDTEVKVIFAESPEGKMLGGLVNFACHTTVMGQELVYSADFPGPMIDKLEDELGGTFMFFQGAAGNLWAVDCSKPGFTESGPEYNQKMGEILAVKAEEAVRNCQKVKGEQVQIVHRVLHIPQRRVSREQVALAKWYLEQAEENQVDQLDFTRKIYGHEYTFFGNDAIIQRWFMRETIGMWEWQRRAGTPDLYEDVEVQAITVGNVAFTAYPAELFTEFGLQTKNESPFEHTFVFETSNGWHGYIPTQQAYRNGGYEPRLGYTCRLVEEAGDRMVDTMLKMLAGLKQGSRV
jgi:neutral ceramidase